MSKRALVVDNDFFFVEFLGELLEKRGYQVTKAYDGKEGLSKLETELFDILFVDLIMPKIDGIQLIKIVRRKFMDSPIPIIAVSGTLMEQIEEITDIGADYYAAKGPLDQMTDDLNALMDRMENTHISPIEKESIIESGTLYPRQVTGELIETLNFQKAITDSIGFGIVVVDKDARIINATSQALEIMDVSLGDILNKHVTSLFPQKERGALIDALKGVAKDLGLRKVSRNVHINSQKIRLTVSLLRFGGDIVGWIVAMEETDL
ncbi:MAG: response regulator [Deltaproteobacteria bacterium]|nr:response regulator [Deltaproteobacteria bacterium]